MKPIKLIALLLVLNALVALAVYKTDSLRKPAPNGWALVEASGTNDAGVVTNSQVSVDLALRQLRESEHLVPSDPPLTLGQVRQWLTNDMQAADDIRGVGSVPSGFAAGVYAAKAEDLRLLARVQDQPPVTGVIVALVHAIDDGIQTTCIEKALADHGSTNGSESAAEAAADAVRAIYYQGVLDTERSLRVRMNDLLPNMSDAQPTVQELPPLRLRFGDRFWRPGWVVMSNGVVAAYEWKYGDETVRVEAIQGGTNQ